MAFFPLKQKYQQKKQKQNTLTSNCDNIFAQHTNVFDFSNLFEIQMWVENIFSSASNFFFQVNLDL